MSSSLYAALSITHALLVLLMPIVLVGIINRSKSWWVGRKGPRILQSASDLWRLLGKRTVVSSVASPLFRAGAYVVLLCGFLSSAIAPVLGQFAPLQFSHDFIVVAYVLGLARMAMVLSAMDVGSAFEGMGAAREVSFSAFAEPALFLLLGTASAATGMTSFADLLGHLHNTHLHGLMAAPLTIALLILLQTEASRVPVDDPLTHLELTMVHEVMILDHSGPELAAMQYAGALKITLYAGLIATLLNPLDPMAAPLAATVISVALMLLVAVVVGCVESLMARLPMQWVPRYTMVAAGAALLCMAVVGMGSISV